MNLGVKGKGEPRLGKDKGEPRCWGRVRVNLGAVEG